MQPGIGADLGDKAKILAGSGVTGERLLKIGAGEIKALITEFHTFFLGAHADLAGAAPDIVGAPLASQAFDLLGDY